VHRRRARRTFRLLAVLAWSLLVAGAVLAPAGPAGAQVGERIRDYDVTITVEPDGELLVHEVIRYDFGPAQRRGILRTIPDRERFDDTTDRLLEIDLVAVTTSPGTPDAVAVEREGDHITFRVGRPEAFITGPHTYEITYRVAGALNAFESHVELYWDAIGPDWGVPVDEAEVRVELPAPPTEVACFAGPVGSTLPCAQATSDGTGASFATDALEPGSTLTVVVGAPVGSVDVPPPILEERWSPEEAFAVTPATAGAAGTLLVGGVAGVAALGWRSGRDRRYVGSHVDVAFGNPDGTDERVPLLDRPLTPVELAPPDDLRPGQIGTLVDEVANPLDVTATIVDLAVRGHLRIEEVAGGGWFSSPDWILHREAPPDGLLPYERNLYGSLFDARHPDRVRISELKDRFASRMRSVQSDLYDDVARQGWFHTRPDRERARWVGIGLAVAALGALLTVLAAATTRYGLVPVPIVLVGLLLAANARHMPHRTAKGTGVLRRVEGFRRFIEESEKERARFAERAHLFTEYLPYAVVFGATDTWARAFAGLDGELPAGRWYTGADAFTLAHFTMAMNGFTVTTAGTLTSVPASSGGSGLGGGGFSGGGFGGGGGGSW
jgi:hypothetical protein